MIDRRGFVACAFAALTVPFAARAQAPPKVARVGVLGWGARPADADPLSAAFLQRLRDHGYNAGQNLQIEFRFADGRVDRLLENTADLVRRNVDVILVAGPGPIRAAHAATTTIPIVMAAGSSDPVGEGLAASLGRPGG